MDEDKLIWEEFSNYRKTHAESLMPMVDRVLQESGCSMADLDGIAVTIGPGSFTGLRIGLAAAKGLSLAANLPLVAVSTLETLSANYLGSEVLACPMLDARRNEVYGAVYETAAYPFPCHCQPGAYAPAAFLEGVRTVLDSSKRRHCMLLGDAIEVYRPEIEKILGSAALTAPQHLRLPRASSLACLGLSKLRQGETQDVLSLSPTYLRQSEAEIKLQKGELK